eukprot:8056507-Pyramimonas_sp.AAC.1
MEALLERSGNSFHCFASCLTGGLENAGGFATAVPAPADGHACGFEPEELVPGRVLRLRGAVQSLAPVEAGV